MTIPSQPKIYHIVHMDRLPSIVADGYLLCDAEVERRKLSGTNIGMNQIKRRRLTELTLASHQDLHVGDCVPFYFCPRSVMLYLIHMRNSELAYRGGQEPIVHLQADLYKCVDWANHQERRWAFTLTNAGSKFFEDRSDLEKLYEINWAAVKAINWVALKEGKQAEFLMEFSFPWELIECIGVHSWSISQQVTKHLPAEGHRPEVLIKTDWYY
jgi:hypothetical protein